MVERNPHTEGGSEIQGMTAEQAHAPRRRPGTRAASLLRPSGIETWILDGWLPEKPFLEPDVPIIGLGSGFAEQLGDHLHERGYTVLSRDPSDPRFVRFASAGVHTFALRQLVEWALDGSTRPLAPWVTRDTAPDDEERLRRQTLDAFQRAGTFVLTLDRSESWYDESTGETFWHEVPRDRYDPGRHHFRVSSVEENLDNLRAVYRSIRAHCPDARIVLTLSPIPLSATFRSSSCITSNSVSKAVLRVAIDELHREVSSEGHLFYWPDYEIVNGGFTGSLRPDRRQVKRPILEYLVQLFEKHYCARVENAAELDQRLLSQYLRARCADGTYPMEILAAIEDGDEDWLTRRLSMMVRNQRYEFAEPLVRRCLDVFPQSDVFASLLARVEQHLGPTGSRSSGAPA